MCYDCEVLKSIFANNATNIQAGRIHRLHEYEAVFGEIKIILVIFAKYKSV